MSSINTYINSSKVVKYQKFDCEGKCEGDCEGECEGALTDSNEHRSVKVLKVPNVLAMGFLRAQLGRSTKAGREHRG